MCTVCISDFPDLHLTPTCHTSLLVLYEYVHIVVNLDYIIITVIVNAGRKRESPIPCLNSQKLQYVTF